MAPKPQDVLGRVTLITGPEEYLAERTVQQVRAAVRQFDPEAEVGETTADQLSLAALGELAAPSLFSSTRCVLVRGLEDLPEESAEGILAYAAAPSDEVALVLLHSGGQKGTGIVNKLRKLPTVTEVKSVTLRPSEVSGFVTAEVRAHGGRIEPDAADALVQAVGTDLRTLAGAASQLVNDFEGQTITAEGVATYFAGRAEVKSFTIADAVMSGRTAAALEELRWAIETGIAPVLVTSAVANGLRGVARMMAAPRGLREGDLAREVGVPPWKLRIVRDQARGWDDDGVARALQCAAQADADIKGAGHDASYTLERLVLTMGDLRAAR